MLGELVLQHPEWLKTKDPTAKQATLAYGLAYICTHAGICYLL